MGTVQLVKKKNKYYVMATCDVCHKDSYYDKEHAVMALRNGYNLFCKYCGAEIETTYMNKELEKLVKKARK